jgi:hypothetical protein
MTILSEGVNLFTKLNQQEITMKDKLQTDDEISKIELLSNRVV